MQTDTQNITQHSAIVVPIINTAYFPVLVNLIGQSKTNIDILMFTARYYQGQSRNIINQFWHALRRAAQRGVKIRLLLNSDFYYGQSKQHNRFICSYFKTPNFNAALAGKSTRLHSKLIIIDDEIIILGSHNHSKRAFTTNFETSMAVWSKEAAFEYKSHFDRLWKSRQIVEVQKS